MQLGRFKASQLQPSPWREPYLCGCYAERCVEPQRAWSAITSNGLDE
jgi:hypothetical protein